MFDPQDGVNLTYGAWQTEGTTQQQTYVIQKQVRDVSEWFRGQRSSKKIKKNNKNNGIFTPRALNAQKSYSDFTVLCALSKSTFPLQPLMLTLT